jgi:hypothetical protein
MIFYPSQLTYLGNASASPLMEEFNCAQAGQSECYWLRWGNTRGDPPPLGANPSPPPSPDKDVEAEATRLK